MVRKWAMFLGQAILCSRAATASPLLQLGHSFRIFVLARFVVWYLLVFGDCELVFSDCERTNFIDATILRPRHIQTAKTRSAVH
jgi:hypothetical protein